MSDILKRLTFFSGVLFFYLPFSFSVASLVLDFNNELFNGTNRAHDISATEVGLPTEDEVNELMESRRRAPTAEHDQTAENEVF